MVKMLIVVIMEQKQKNVEKLSPLNHVTIFFAVHVYVKIDSKLFQKKKMIKKRF